MFDARLLSGVEVLVAVVASEDYLQRHGWPKQPGDLKSHSCIHYRDPQTGPPLRMGVPPRERDAPGGSHWRVDHYRCRHHAGRLPRGGGHRADHGGPPRRHARSARFRHRRRESALSPADT